jgi:2'-5' RNA ligase
VTALRLFIAVHFTPAIEEALVALIAALGRDPSARAARWVRRENLHVTLKFLGDTDDRRLPDVFAAVALAAAGLEPFALTVANLGCFPNTARPRIVWAGIGEGAARLTALAQDLDTHLAARGFAREERPFSAHITLARADRGATAVELAALGRVIAGRGPVPVGTMTVGALQVVKSDLRPTGPAYTVLRDQPLGRPETV